MSVDAVESEDGGSETEPRGEVGEKCWHMMTAHAREFCFVLTIVFTAYAALQSSSLKTKKFGIPKRFFPWNSFVTDYYLGTIDLAFERISESDVTFVMYYAPWDASSMEARWEFDKTAKYFHHNVQFLAINCWWTEGECRQHFRRINSYPILMAYPGVNRGIQFRGPYLLPHMFRFLEKLLRPVRPIFNLNDLLNLRARYDTVVVGYFDFHISPHPPGFVAYHNTAMKALERDPGNGVCFAIVSEKELASLIGLTESKSFVLLRFNDTVDFSLKSSSDTLLSWTFKERQPSAQWLNLPKSKSLLLSSILEKSSPALIMFTPQNPLIDSNPYFNLLNEIAMDYYNCNHTTQVQRVIDRSISLGQAERFQAAKCDSIFETNDLSWFHQNGFFSSPKCCYSLPTRSSNRVCDLCLVHEEACRDLLTFSKTNAFANRQMNSSGEICEEMRIDCYSPASIVYCCREKDETRFSNESNDFTSSVGSDDRVVLAVQEYEEFRCVKHEASKAYGEIKLPGSSDFPWMNNFSGLGCRTNRTLNFVAIDSQQFDALTTNLGVNLSDFHHRTAVLIHHTQQEIQHLLREIVNKRSLVEFISNFTDNQLGRYLRTTERTESICAKSKVCVVEVTSSTFSSVILNPDIDVVLFYYASWCGFCSGVSHIFLEAAEYFKTVPKIVFARINGDRNDLPWEFTANKYPTIIFFPAGRKSESRVFPEELQISLSNLVNFVLANAGFENRLLFATKLCYTKNCLIKNRRRLLTHVQRLNGDIRLLTSRLYRVDIALRDTEDVKKKSSLVEYKEYLKTQLRKTKVQFRRSKQLNLIVNTAQFNYDQLSDILDRFVSDIKIR